MKQGDTEGARWKRMRNACKILVGKLVATTYKTQEQTGVY